MKWEKVRELYPNQFVLLKVLSHHTSGNKRYIDEVAVVRGIDNPKEVTKLLVNGQTDDLVYHTKNEEIVVEIKNLRAYRGMM